MRAAVAKTSAACALIAAGVPEIAVAPPAPRTPARIAATMDALVAAYPGALLRHDGRMLYWKSGAATPIGAANRARTAEQVLSAPDIADIFAWTYPPGPTPRPTGDPGRTRPAAFFARLYGDCRKGAVMPQLVPVKWVGGKSVQFTRIAGAAAALEAVARDLEKLGPEAARALWPISGTYNCRTIAGSDALSMHAMGAAIDLNSAYGRYWRWSAERTSDPAIPQQVISTFERHGFIWGGKWAHFDTFHFEYRPELIRMAGR